jgi:citrate synthase
MTDFWKTAISRVRPNEILVRGYPIEQLVENCSFGDTVFLLLTGDLPRGKEGKLIEAMLVGSCEHSLASPSVDAVRFVASSGVPLQTAVAAGISAIGDVHGGAIEPCARMLQNAVAKGASAEEVINAFRAEKKRIPGFGHPVHTDDPRSDALLKLAKQWQLAGPHTQLAKEMEALTSTLVGRRLTINVDGIIAALLCDMGIDPALGKAIFIIGRAPGYCAHSYEQSERERPFKAAAWEDITYTGPDRRDVEKDDA